MEIDPGDVTKGSNASLQSILEHYSHPGSENIQSLAKAVNRGLTALFSRGPPFLVISYARRMEKKNKRGTSSSYHESLISSCGLGFEIKKAKQNGLI